MKFLNHKILEENFVGNKKGITYFIVNLMCLFLALSIFFSGLYGIQDAVVYHLANQEPKNSGANFIDSFFHFTGEQRILYLLEAMKYQFWIFALLFVRTVMLLMRNLLSIWIASFSLIITFVLTIIYYRWASSVDDFNFLLFVPKWFLGCLTILIFMSLAIEVFVNLFFIMSKPKVSKPSI